MNNIALAEPRHTPTDPYAARERHHNEGHGRRLTGRVLLTVAAGAVAYRQRSFSVVGS